MCISELSWVHDQANNRFYTVKVEAKGPQFNDAHITFPTFPNFSCNHYMENEKKLILPLGQVTVHDNLPLKMCLSTY